MLPFGEFPLRKGAFLGSPIQVSSVLKLLALTRGGIAACRALLRLSSRAILQIAWHVRASGSVCLAFGENLIVFSTYLLIVYFVVLRVVILAYAWCHSERSHFDICGLLSHPSLHTY